MIMTIEERKQYMQNYYQLNKERMDKRRLINYHNNKKKLTTTRGPKRRVDLSALPPTALQLSKQTFS